MIARLRTSRDLSTAGRQRREPANSPRSASGPECHPADSLVSIVLPTRGGSPWLDASIASCVAQTHRHWELLVVDDGGGDRVERCVATWAQRDERVRLLRHRHNRGLAAALTTGFAAARGTFLTWTSDDNEYRPGALAGLVAALAACPEAAVVYSGYTLVDESGAPVCSRPAGRVDDLAVGNAVGPCFLYDRRVQERLRCYSEADFLAEDYEFWLRASQSFALQPVAGDFYLYRLHGESLTHRHGTLVHDATDRVLRRHIWSLRWAEPEARARGHVRLAASALRVFRPGTLMAHLCAAAWLSPGVILDTLRGAIRRRAPQIPSRVRVRRPAE